MVCQRILALETLRERNNQQLLAKDQELEKMRQQLSAKGGEVSKKDSSVPKHDLRKGILRMLFFLENAVHC